MHFCYEQCEAFLMACRGQWIHWDSKTENNEMTIWHAELTTCWASNRYLFANRAMLIRQHYSLKIIPSLPEKD